MERPKTPFDRLMEDTNLSESVKGRLQEEKMNLNPWTLRSELRSKLKKLWKYFVAEIKWTAGEFHVA
jgi:hypothetical protein